MKSMILLSILLSGLVAHAAPVSEATDKLNHLMGRSCGAPTSSYFYAETSQKHSVGDIWTQSGVCNTEPVGTLTFNMVVGETTLGLPGSTEAQGTSFVIQDHTCKILGIFTPPNCDPSWIIEAPYLKYVLAIQDVNMDPAGGYYKFVYANGEYSIGNNGCKCHSLPASGLGIAEGCSCTFPYAGQPN